MSTFTEHELAPVDLLRPALVTAVDRLADVCQLMRLQEDLRLVELGRRLEEDLQNFHRVLEATAPPAP